MEKRSLKPLSRLIFLVFFFVGCQPQTNQTVCIYSASGLSPVVNSLKELAEYESLSINSSSSGILARQITSGAEADIYFSANYKWVEYLLDAKVIDNSKVEVLAANKLVMIVPKKDSLHVPSDSLHSFLNKASVIAIGNPDYVPVGEYAKKYLTQIGEFDFLLSKFLKAKDVMSTLKLVEIGEADLGFVYKTVALQSEKVNIVHEVNDSLCGPINFYSVTLTDKGARLFNDASFKEKLKDELYKAGFN